VISPPAATRNKTRRHSKISTCSHRSEETKSETARDAYKVGEGGGYETDERESIRHKAAREVAECIEFVELIEIVKAIEFCAVARECRASPRSS
jgi:hypothetical protein